MTSPPNESGAPSGVHHRKRRDVQRSQKRTGTIAEGPASWALLAVLVRAHAMRCALRVAVETEIVERSGFRGRIHPHDQPLSDLLDVLDHPEAHP